MVPPSQVIETTMSMTYSSRIVVAYYMDRNGLIQLLRGFISTLLAL